MSVKINQLEIENAQRVKAIVLTPSASGLTIIGGDNRQGKTSALNNLAWLLGGDRFKPSNPYREGSVLPPMLHVELSNGLIAERKGKNSELKVIDPNGNKSGQQILNEFVEPFALNLPKFMQANNKEKAETLLRIIGVGNQLHELELKENEIYNKRLAIGQIADQKKKYAAEMTFYPDAPKDLVSASELIKQQQDILARNGENQRKRDNAFLIQAQRNSLAEKVNSLKEELERYTKQLEEAEQNMTIAFKTAEALQDESTEELERNIADIDTINTKVRANLNKEKAETDAQEYSSQYNGLSAEIAQVRQSKIDLLNSAKLPLPGLSVEDGELTYNGYKWDGISGADQLKVATAIVRSLNPKCGFVLMDKLEQMDLKTLNEFGAWLEAEDLQVIATRVSTGKECSIIIEDGYAVPDTHTDVTNVTDTHTWKAGEF